MAEFENSVGQSDEWYTPPEIFDAIGEVFDLDPCSPGVGHWVPARRILTKADDGLSAHWGTGEFVFMNPPFGGRNGHVPWLVKFLQHGYGIAIVRAYTSSGWFHDHVASRAECILFPRGKTQFVRPNGTVGKSPGHGVCLIGMGARAIRALRNSKLGLFVELRRWPRFEIEL